MTDEQVDLLPCPFCGGEADISHDHTVEECHAYGCRKCDLWFGFNSDDPVKDWNTRAAMQHTPQEAAKVLLRISRDAADHEACAIHSEGDAGNTHDIIEAYLRAIAGEDQTNDR